MRTAPLFAAVAAIFLMAFDGPIENQDKMPEAYAHRDAALELCQAHVRAHEFKNATAYSVCYAQAMRAYWVEIEWKDMAIIDGFEQKFLLVANEYDRHLIGHKKLEELENQAIKELMDDTNDAITVYAAELQQKAQNDAAAEAEREAAMRDLQALNAQMESEQRALAPPPPAPAPPAPLHCLSTAAPGGGVSTDCN